MRRAVIAALVAVMGVGCTNTTAGGPEGEDGGRATIRVQVWGEPEETAVYESLVTAFEQDVPNIDVELIKVVDRDEHLAKIASTSAAGNPPDVFLINYREYPPFVVRGAVEPVEDLMTERDVALEDYFEQPIEAFTFDGELQCMPQNISSLVVYYNQALFKRAGLERPADDWSWEEFRDTALALTQGEVDGVGIDPQIIRVAPFVWSNGGEIVDDPVEPTRFTLDSPEAREALEFIISLVRDDGVVPTEEELSAQDTETRFASGKLGMLLSSRRDTPVFREVNGLRWDVAPLPVADEPAGILHSDAYCITAASEQKEAAADFVAYAIGEPGQTLTALGGRTVPSLESVARSGAFLDPSQPPAHSKVFLDGVPHIRTVPVMATWPEIEDVAAEILTRAFYEPGYTIDQAIEDLEEETTSLFAEASG